jgi:hypothetical protein
MGSRLIPIELKSFCDLYRERLTVLWSVLRILAASL